MDSEHNKAFRKTRSQNPRGLRLEDCVGQLTEPPRPSNCLPKVWFVCCLTVRGHFLHESHVLSLKKGHFVEEFWKIIKQTPMLRGVCQN